MGWSRDRWRGGVRVFQKACVLPNGRRRSRAATSGRRAVEELPIDSVSCFFPRRRGLVGVALALVSCGAVAQLVDENVLLPLPGGYRIGYENKTPRALIVEMVKAGETVENWTELLTSQTFYNPAAQTPAIFKAAADRAGTQFCPGFESRVFNEDPENGYPAIAWVSSCANNPATSKPEWTFFKAIRGKDALYVVHKAFRFEPNNDQVKEASMTLRRVSACDTRTPEHPCPTMTQPSR